MKKIIVLAIACLFLFPITDTAFSAGIPGATNKSWSATLLVPFFEVGIDETADPMDTLLVVTTINSRIIHYHVWDIDGNPTELMGNVDLAMLESWSVSMRTLISGASAATKTELTQGDYYRGFVTIDVVTETTTTYPTDSSYPFGTSNELEGYIYYVRLTQGSSNGIDMIPIEYVGSSVNQNLRDFYQTDGREEIDGYARKCLESMSQGGTCDFVAGSVQVGIDSRVFLDPALSASSRIIVFTWIPQLIGGPSIYCETAGCATSYAYWRMNEAGTPLVVTSIALNHVVNVIDVSGEENGWVEIGNVPGEFQILAFSFNSASPPSFSANWDAIFESFLTVD
jgi:hypothetical protein